MTVSHISTHNILWNLSCNLRQRCAHRNQIDVCLRYLAYVAHGAVEREEGVHVGDGAPVAVLHVPQLRVAAHLVDGALSAGGERVAEAVALSVCLAEQRDLVYVGVVEAHHVQHRVCGGLVRHGADLPIVNDVQRLSALGVEGAAELLNVAGPGIAVVGMVLVAEQLLQMH